MSFSLAALCLSGYLLLFSVPVYTKW